MNFKSLALASVLAVGSLFGGMAPAEAGTCWFDNGAGRLVAEYCKTSSRVNANGHNVWDVVDGYGNKVTLVFWAENPGYSRSGEVEFIMNGQVSRGYWEIDRQGDRRLYVNGQEMAIRF